MGLGWCLNTRGLGIAILTIITVEPRFKDRRYNDLFIYLSTIFIQDHPVQLKAGLNGGLFTYITTLTINIIYRENLKLQTINTCKDQKVNHINVFLNSF